MRLLVIHPEVAVRIAATKPHYVVRQTTLSGHLQTMEKSGSGVSNRTARQVRRDPLLHPQLSVSATGNPMAVHSSQCDAIEG
jgi:hypothetical protein